MPLHHYNRAGKEEVVKLCKEAELMVNYMTKLISWVGRIKYFKVYKVKVAMLFTKYIFITFIYNHLILNFPVPIHSTWHQYFCIDQYCVENEKCLISLIVCFIDSMKNDKIPEVVFVLDQKIWQLLVNSKSVFLYCTSSSPFPCNNVTTCLVINKNDCC